MSATLDKAELQRVTGYLRPAEVLRELLRQGFYRARMSPRDKRVVLERPHFDAVCAGALKPTDAPRVKLRAVL